MKLLSITIITFNEEKNIARCIESLQEVADEIIVVDSFSTDSTIEICNRYPVRIVQNAFVGHIEQKNYAASLAQYPFILSLDADEALSPELKTSILNEKEKGFPNTVYQFSRLTQYCGKWIRHCGWYPDRKIRLWQQSIGEWGGVNPHDTIILNSNLPIQTLKGDLLHYSFHTIEQHIQQIQFFTTISSKAAFLKGKRSSYLDLIFRPLFKFFRDYFLKKGVLDGYYGFVICVNSAFAKWLKYIKLRELQKSKPL